MSSKDYKDIEPGIKIAAQMSPEPSQKDIDFVLQMGIEYVVLWTDGRKAGYDYYSSRKKLFEEAGLKVYGFGNSDVHNQDAIVLNTSGKETSYSKYIFAMWKPLCHTL